MYQPDREGFRALARNHAVVPVWREVLGDLITPVAAFQRVVGDGLGFLLESVEHGERWSRFSFVGRNPRATITARGANLTVEGTVPDSMPRDQGVLAAAEALLAHYRSPVMNELPSLHELPPLHGGLVGYLGYDVVREIEHLTNTPTDDQGLPDAVLSIIGQLAVFDHWRQRVVLIDNVLIDNVVVSGESSESSDAELDELYDQAIERLDELAADGARAMEEPVVDPPAGNDALADVQSSMSASAWEQAVAVAKEHILDGDIFQVVLSQRFDFDLDADPFAVYRVLRQVNPSPYMYFLRNHDVTLVGSSPEPMVQVLDRRVISRPIAGTRRRGATDQDDRRLAGELIEHPKERAEHVMLVDLARNDVGRVVEFGTEQMDELMTLERYSHVMHITSQVSGQLRDGLGPIDVLRATFPAGTVSGAPKVRAMEIIDDLEPVKRGPYAGVVGYIDFSGNLDTAIAIRTMVIVGNKACVQAGAGIVADSIASQEALECRNKAAALLAAVPAARRMRNESGMRMESNMRNESDMTTETP